MLSKKEEKEFWLNWLNQYKSLKCLWDETEKRKAGKIGRERAYQILVNLTKKINDKADIKFVRRRINTFRTVYRREMFKVQNDTNYEPQLFYYKTLDFLNDSPDLIDSKYNSEDEDENDPLSGAPKKTLKPLKKASTKKYSVDDSTYDTTIPNNLKLEMNYVPPERTAKSKSRVSQKTHIVNFQDCDDSVESISIAELDRKTDEYDVLGSRIAAHFRNMTHNQRLIAEKIISDVCIYGRMERLTLDTTIYLDSTTNC